jgi:predicted house-cleaning noncanonical NTP pyrophosphatase (MazG superfamily)
LADHTEMAGMGDVEDPEGLQRVAYARRTLAELGFSQKGSGAAEKLVRDRTPEIITAQGRHPIVRVAVTDEELETLLRGKLQEEVAKFLGSGDPVELVDILEVVYGLASVAKVSVHQLEFWRHDKAVEQGSFEDGVVLIDVQ